ncbi:hypothetical protein ABH13_3514 [Bacillus velezensis]|nr:hypothetical protein ABH13_3514 [Bacillus velezensis]RUR98339.1 hypothetical protein EFW57_02713 [Bacillus velezensis]
MLFSSISRLFQRAPQYLLPTRQSKDWFFCAGAKKWLKRSDFAYEYLKTLNILG